MIVSIRQIIKWCAVYLMFVLAGLSSLHTVESREISSITVDLIENGKEKEAIIDLKEKTDKPKNKGLKHKKEKSHKKKNKKGKKKSEKLEDVETIEKENLEIEEED